MWKTTIALLLLATAAQADPLSGAWTPIGTEQPSNPPAPEQPLPVTPPVNKDQPRPPSQPNEGNRVQQKTSYIGAFVGPALVTSTTNGGTSNFLTYGGHVGVGVGPMSNGGTLSLGVALDTMSQSMTLSGVKLDEQDTAIMGEVLGRGIGGTGFYLGGRFGVYLASLTASIGINSISVSSTTGAVAPVVGYEIPLAPQISIAADISWLTHFPGSLTIGTTKVDYPSASALLFQGGLTAHF